MRGLALVVLCACNQVFGLSATHSTDGPRAIDAQQFDAPVDAPFGCPAAGVPPVFSELLHQIVFTNCLSYTLSEATNTAVAECFEPSNAFYQGPIGQPMSPLVMATQYTQVQSLAIVPEGDRLYGAGFGSASAWQFSSFVPATTGWTDGAVQTLPFNFDRVDAWTVMTRGPMRRMLYSHLTTRTIEELVESSPDTWTDVRPTPYTAADLGVTFVSGLQLSADGLRLIAYGQPTSSTSYSMLYTSRPDLAHDFPPFAPMVTVPSQAQYPFMTEDCARVYFSALGNVMYVQQQ